MSEFTDKAILVTGAAGALGRALTDAFVAGGANVVGARKHGEQIAAELAGGAVGLTFDVTSEAAWAYAIAQAERRLGAVDVLVNNAAYLHVGTTESIGLAEWHKVIEMTLTGALLGIQAGVPSMRKRGGNVIVNINSIAGLQAAPGLVSYSSKRGLRGLMCAAASELARDGIRVNAVHTGIIDTPLAYAPDGSDLVPTGAFAIPTGQRRRDRGFRHVRRGQQDHLRHRVRVRHRWRLLARSRSRATGAGRAARERASARRRIRSAEFTSGQERPLQYPREDGKDN